MEAFEYMTVFGRWHFVLPFELHPFVRLCTPYGWKYLHGRQLLRDYAMNLLQQRKKEDEATWATRTDIVSIFLSRKDDDGKPFTDVFLRDAILLMFFAGRDTTVSSAQPQQPPCTAPPGRRGFIDQAAV